MRIPLLCLALVSLLTGCATSHDFRVVNLDPATFTALCGPDTAGRHSPPIALASNPNSPIPAGAVLCGASRGPSSPEYQKVALTFAKSDMGLTRPSALILVSASRPDDGRLSAALADAIKIQASMSGMARVVMLDKTALTDQGIYLGYAYP